MRNARLWHRVLGLARTVIERVEFDECKDALVVWVRPRKSRRRRCGRCGKPAGLYDRGEGRRYWRGLDLATTRVLLCAEAPRVNCRLHGPTVAEVPWARHGARHSRDFEDTVGWLVGQCSKTAITMLMRIGWDTVGTIIGRIQAEDATRLDRLEGVRRIGIDETTWTAGNRFITVVVDHDTGHMLWAGVGKTEATLHKFFTLLGPERSAALTHISADGASWIDNVIARRAPQARKCADPFHVVKWAGTALEVRRRQAWNDARGGPNQSNSERAGHKHPTVHPLKRIRWALRKKPENHTARQQAQIAWLARTDPALHRAWQLKEALRMVFALSGQQAKDALDGWISWARRSRLPEFVELQRRIIDHLDAIHNTFDSGLSNALCESTNTKLRNLRRMAYGFTKPEHLIALGLFTLGGHRPNLPNRT